MQPRLSRRSALKATGSLGLGIATGSIFVGNAAAGDHKFVHQLNTARATTRKYKDLDTATDEDEGGYSFFGITPFVGIVYANQSNIGNTDPAKDPSLLFYAPTRGADIGEEEDIENTNTILAGIEYHVEGRGQGDQDMFADDEASGRVKVREEDGWHSSPPGVPPLTGLHVWAHLHNPDGVFALQHPVIRDRLTD